MAEPGGFEIPESLQAEFDVIKDHAIVYGPMVKIRLWPDGMTYEERLKECNRLRGVEIDAERTKDAPRTKRRQ